MAREIATKGQIDYNNVTLESYCNTLCKNIYDVLCEFQLGDDYEVTYVSRIDAESIQTLGYYNKCQRHPRTYKTPRRINDNNAYIDAQRFRDPSNSSNICLGEKQIDESFIYDRGKIRKQTYKQYISIPVYCENEGLVGLVQIVALNKSRIVTSEEQFDYISNNYLTPLSLLFLYISKMEQAITAVPPLK